MAQAKFHEMEMTTSDGEVIKYLEGEVLTRHAKLIVRCMPVVDEGANINANEYSHKVEVKANWGDFIDSGVMWSKRNKEGTFYYSISMNDPSLNISLWGDDDNEGVWIARANSIRSAA